jgi:hypothetical protein
MAPRPAHTVQIRIGFSWSRLLGRVAVGALTGLSAGILLGYLWLPNTMQAPRDPLIMAGMLAMVALLATRKAAFAAPGKPSHGARTVRRYPGLYGRLVFGAKPSLSV